MDTRTYEIIVVLDTRACESKKCRLTIYRRERLPCDDIGPAYLIPALVPDKDYERAMVVLDIIADQDRQPRVQLLAHGK